MVDRSVSLAEAMARLRAHAFTVGRSLVLDRWTAVVLRDEKQVSGVARAGQGVAGEVAW